MDILTATQKDAKQILDLQKKAYQQEARIYNDFKIPPLTQTLDEITAEFETHVFLKAVGSAHITGSVRACSAGTTCFIGRLIVHPDHQGKGVGTKLMAAIEGRFKKCRRFELFTGSKSHQNIRLYKRLGYIPYARKKIHSGLTLIYLDKKNNQ